MNRQMTAAPTIEIASGRKTKTLASASRLIRSNSVATARPIPTLPPVPSTSQMMLLRKASHISGEVRTKPHVLSGAPFSVKLATIVATAGTMR